MYVTIAFQGGMIGLFTGILPGAGGSISNILAYDQAKKTSKTPEKFGTGVPDGGALVRLRVGRTRVE